MRQPHSIINKFTLCCSIISFTVCLVSRISFDIPIGMLHIVKGICLLPPIWIYNLISYAWFFLIGLAFGALLDKTLKGINGGNDEIAVYKGGIFFITSLFLGLIHYHIFFIAEMLFLAFLVSAMCMMSALITATLWRYVRPKVSCFIMYCFTIWQFYLFFVSLSVFLNN